MTSNTINDSVTMPGGAEGALLANRYRIVRQLGSGGMGSVWLAEDTQLDNKPFAIKMLPSILVSNKRAYRQLKDEALVAMKLVHPNIVQIRAFEENNGNPFLVMDYIEGQTLDDYLAEKGTLPEDETIELLTPIAAALDYAHGENVVHRDVKPANVMIRKDGHPFILDFGIAREMQETMTRVTGKMSSGTLLYMSPEQLQGKPPGPSQDVYSFAAMVYECLKGEPPFSRGQIEYQILNQMPEPLSAEVTVTASIMAALAKLSEDRPSSCRAVVGGDKATDDIKPQASKSKTFQRTETSSLTKSDGYDPEEVSSLIRLRAKIKVRLEEVDAMIMEVHAYRGDGAGITSHVDKAEDTWKMLRAIEPAPNSPREAEATLSVVTEAVASICAELDWLKRNRLSRDGAVALMSEIDNGLIPEMLRYPEDASARQVYAEGKKFRDDGERYFSLCDYIEAYDILSTAKECLSSAVSITRNNSILDHIGKAKQMAGVGRWVDCQHECDLVLGWDPSDSEALRLRDEAALNLVQRARLRILAGGESLADGTALNINGVECLTPVVWDEYEIVKHAAGDGDVLFLGGDGRRYCGKIDDLNGNWQGTREFTVELREFVLASGNVVKLALPGGEAMEMIYCAPGEFVMGSDDIRYCDEEFSHQQHTVRLTRGFLLGRYPVTQKQWRSVMGVNPSKWRGDDLPVENVSWNACLSFMERINRSMSNPFYRECRFPTEAEWEYACRAGSPSGVVKCVDDWGGIAPTVAVRLIRLG